MRKLMLIIPVRMLLGFWLVLSFGFLVNIEILKAEDATTVEGVWEMVSTNAEGWQRDAGAKMKIVRKDGGYEVTSIGGIQTIFSGDGTSIVYTYLEDLGGEPGERHGAGDNIPEEVKRQVSGQKVPINISYEVSADGNYLTRSQDGKWLYWDTEPAVRFTNYEIKPSFYRVTFKRISGPTQSSPPVSDAIAQVESRGEFYFLTKDGRKVSGDEASKIPLEEGTKLVTGKDGHVKMTLPDNTTFTVGPGSDIVIDEFVYDPDNSPKKVIATMTKGVFRWVTGKVYGDAAVYKDPAQMKVNLPVVAVGIRGTDFEMTVAPDGSGSVVLNFGQLEIAEKKTGFTFLMNAGEKITFGVDGSVSRPVKVN